MLVEPSRSPRRRAGTRAWVVVGAGLFALAKARAVPELLHHRAQLVVVLAVGVAASILRPRPVRLAVFLAPLVALVLSPVSTALGVGLGVGVFALLIAAFAVIATILHSRQRRATGILDRWPERRPKNRRGWSSSPS